MYIAKSFGQNYFPKQVGKKRNDLKIEYMTNESFKVLRLEDLSYITIRSKLIPRFSPDTIRERVGVFHTPHVFLLLYI